VHFPDDGKRHELIDGEHYVTPSPNLRHQRISGRLHLLIGTWLEAHPIGELVERPEAVHPVAPPQVELQRLPRHYPFGAEGEDRLFLLERLVHLVADIRRLVRGLRQEQQKCRRVKGQR